MLTRLRNLPVTGLTSSSMWALRRGIMAPYYVSELISRGAFLPFEPLMFLALSGQNVKFDFIVE